MDDALFQARIDEARARIEALPEEHRGPLRIMLEETIRRHRELKDNFARIHHAVGELQLFVKYLLFDHEATRRERDELRRRLGELG